MIELNLSYILFHWIQSLLCYINQQDLNWIAGKHGESLKAYKINAQQDNKRWVIEGDHQSRHQPIISLITRKSPLQLDDHYSTTVNKADVAALESNWTVKHKARRQTYQMKLAIKIVQRSNYSLHLSRVSTRNIVTTEAGHLMIY